MLGSRSSPIKAMTSKSNGQRGGRPSTKPTLTADQRLRQQIQAENQRQLKQRLSAYS